MNLLPYPEYKDSGVEWLGEVPSHWRVAPIKFVASYNDEVLQESTPSEAEIRYIEISDVNEAAGIRFNDPIHFGEAPSRARRIVRQGDVLVSTVRTYLRSIAGVQVACENVIASTGFAVLRAARMEPRFLQYGMLTEYVIDEVISRSVGISYPAINASDLVRVKLPIPSVEEQRAIADFLDHETAEIDAFIADQNELIGLLNERRAATITQAVTKGLDPNVQMKDSGVEWLGDVPVGWAVHKMFWLARIGNGSTPSTEKAAYWFDGQIPWLNSSCVNERLVTVPSKYVTDEAKRECHLPLVRKSSLLVGLTGQGKTRGMTTRLGIESTINQHLAYIEPGKGFLSSFAYWFMKSAYDYLRFLSDGNGGTKGGLTCDQLGRVRVPLPSTEEQQRIADYLDHETAEIDAAIADAKEAIKLSKERRAALISAAVTGKIDVRDHERAKGTA